MENGDDIKTYIEGLLKNQIIRPSIDEILAPFRQEVEASEITDDEFDNFVEEIREEIYQEKLAKQREE